MKIPFVIVGDWPEQQTGLARILRDLLTRIATEFGEVLDVRVVGYAPYGDLPPHGVTTTTLGVPGQVYGNFATRGVASLSASYRSWFGTTPGIVFTIWDPGRCEMAQVCDLPVEWWGYFAVDAHNLKEKIAGPALQYLKRYTRVLGYGAYGAGVLEASLGKPVGALPHGIDPDVFWPRPTEGAAAILGQPAMAAPFLVGAVAANQRRKDFGLVARVLQRFPTAWLWIHTDRLVGEHWSLPQLLEDADLTQRVTVTTNLSDAQLALCYSACDVTIAPGRGEGFGYPIVESLACGTPVVHTAYAGGRDLTPEPGRVVPRDFTLEGPYALYRPVLDPLQFSGAVQHYLSEPRTPRNVIARHATAYRWPEIWPAWAQWIRGGLNARAVYQAQAAWAATPTPTSTKGTT